MKTHIRSNRFATTVVSLAVGSVLMSANAAALDYAQGRLLVRFGGSVSEAEIASVLKANMARELRRMDGLDARVIEVPLGFETHLAERLGADARIALAEPDGIAPAAMIPNDTYYGYAWHLPKIQAPNAWDFSLGDGVVVAVVDSGVDPDHPELVGQLVEGWNAVSGNTNTEDLCGHGTSVAGVIGAASNNALGVSGAAWNVSLMPVRVSETAYNETTTSLIADGIIWAADHGARIINVSYEINTSSIVALAAQYARSLGAVVVVGAGNTGTESSYANPDLIAVSATDANDAVTSWSTYGSVVDLAAPGSGIVTTGNGGGFASSTGTSFAAPVVSGVAALMLAANQDLDVAAIEQILKDSADDIGAPGDDLKSGAGRVNAYAAVQMALAWATPAPPPADEEAPAVAIGAPTAGAEVSGAVAVQVDASDDVGVTEVKLFANGTLLGSDTAAPYAVNLNTTAYPNGALDLVAQAYDAAGNEAISSAVTVTVYNAPADTTPPTAAITAPTANKTVSGTVTVKSVASDDVQLASMTLYVDNVQLCTGAGPALNCNWNAQAAARGYHYLKLTARDAAGNSKSHEVRVKR